MRDRDMEDIGAGNTFEEQGKDAKRGDNPGSGGTGIPAPSQRREPSGRSAAGTPLGGDSVDENIGSYQEKSGATTSPGGPSAKASGAKDAGAAGAGTDRDPDAGAGKKRARGKTNDLEQPGQFGDQGYGLDTDEVNPSS